MSTPNFFRINLPFGLKRNEKGKWIVFNQLRMPLGWHDSIRLKELAKDQELPLYRSFDNLTPAKLKDLAYGDKGIIYDESGNIIQILLFEEPFEIRSNSKNWPAYLEKLKKLAKLEVE